MTSQEQKEKLDTYIGRQVGYSIIEPRLNRLVTEKGILQSNSIINFNDNTMILSYIGSDNSTTFCINGVLLSDEDGNKIIE